MLAFLAILFFPVAAACGFFSYRFAMLIPVAFECFLIVNGVGQLYDCDEVEQAFIATEDVIGVWRFEDESVEFKADGSFVGLDGNRSKWTKEGMLTADGLLWISLRKKGELVLLPRTEFGDPDEWSVHYVFRRVGAADEDGGMPPQ